MKKLLLTLTFLSVSVSTFAAPVSTPNTVNDSPVMGGNYCTRTCPYGTYNLSTGKCQADPTITCPSGGTYNSYTQKCEASAS